MPPSELFYRVQNRNTGYRFSAPPYNKNNLSPGPFLIRVGAAIDWVLITVVDLLSPQIYPGT
jgi:hypothetical protein